MTSLKKTALAAACALAALSAGTGAHAAVVFSGTATGSWGPYVAGADNPNPNDTINNSDGVSTGSNHVATFNFGTGDGTPPNIFTFDGAGSDSHAAVAGFSNVAPGTLFDIGRFTYYNGTTTAGTAADTVTLAIALALSVPTGLGTGNYSYNFGIDLTPNTTGNPVLDGDIVTINNGVTSTTFTSNNVTYTLALKGFSTDGGKTFTSQFLSPEGSTATADIYAVINQPSLVPEPASMVLMGVGMIGTAVVARRRRQSTITPTAA